MNFPRLFHPDVWQPPLTAANDLALWLRQRGGWLLKQEQELLGRLLPGLFGYHLLELGLPSLASLSEASVVRHRVRLGLQPDAGDWVQADQEALPLQSNSVDVVLLHHVLDVTQEPHTVLREAARVLIPGGHMVIVGFNPWSLYGVGRLLFGWRQQQPWAVRALSPARLGDWLQVLGLDMIGYESVAPELPLSNPEWRQRMVWLAWLGRRLWRQRGAVYLLLVSKRESCMTPVQMQRLAWQGQLVGALLGGKRPVIGVRGQFNRGQFYRGQFHHGRFHDAEWRGDAGSD